MVEYDLGNIENVIGFDEYINERLAESNKKICQLERENRRLRLIVRLQKDIIDSYKELAEIVSNKVVIE